MKGCPKENVKKEVDDMINVLGLEPKRNSFSMTLSGGQKRKLSVGIALIAGSKVRENSQINVLLSDEDQILFFKLIFI